MFDFIPLLTEAKCTTSTGEEGHERPRYSYHQKALGPPAKGVCNEAEINNHGLTMLLEKSL